MRFSTAIFAALAALVSAYTQPDYSNPPSGNPIATPGLNQMVDAGQPFTITWTPTTTGPVSLVLLRGPSENVLPIETIVEQIPNSGRFVWTPSTNLEPDISHYGLQLVVEGTGQYQYSTQFGVTNIHYRSSSTSTSASADSSSSSSSSSSSPSSPSSLSPSSLSWSSSTWNPAPTEAATSVATAPARSSTNDGTSTRRMTVTTTICTGTATSSSMAVIGTGHPRVSSTAISSSKSHIQPTLQAKVSALSTSGSGTSVGPITPLKTGAAGRNVISLGAVAGGMLAALAF